MSVFKHVMQNPYTCVTGGAGTGKSTFIKSIKEFFGMDTLFVSSTGLAAINIGGTTCHRQFKLPLGVTDQLDPLMNKNLKFVLGSKDLSRIIIDEGFMLRGDHLIHIDQRLQKIRRNKQPFGGLSVCVVGDPLQLQSILRNEDKQDYRNLFGEQRNIFQTQLWKDCGFKHFELTEVKRQSDKEFIKALHSIRKADEDVKWAIDYINSSCLNKSQQGVILTPTNYNVDQYNRSEFYKLDTQIFMYEGKAVGFTGEKPVPENIQLRKGARVVLCANKENMFVNGDTGVVVGAGSYCVDVELDRGGVVIVDKFRFSQIEYKIINGKMQAVEKGWYEQLPIKLGYALSIHKSQGQTIPKMTLDIGRGAFAPHMTYVALSRAVSLDGLSLTQPIKEKDVWVDKEVIDWMNNS